MAPWDDTQRPPRSCAMRLEDSSEPPPRRVGRGDTLRAVGGGGERSPSMEPDPKGWREGVTPEKFRYDAACSASSLQRLSLPERAYD